MSVEDFPAPYRAGIDVGGTFTDVVLVSAAGGVKAFKSISDPSDPAASVLNALHYAARGIGLDLPALVAHCRLIVHGSTIAVNTILEKKGARVGLLATAGFRDSLEIRRGLRRDVWNYREPNPEVLVPRYLRLAVRGRLNAEGVELESFAEGDVRAAVDFFLREGVESIAICLLHSYRNPAHEHRARDAVSSLWPEAWISCSCDVAPILGEYERGSTTVLNAYVMPRVVPYLAALHRELKSLGLTTDLLLMQSNGGAISVNEIGHRPIHLALSGPAAAVAALQYFGTDAGSTRLVSIEVGGTSCDVALAVDGAVTMTDQITIDDYHINLPAVQMQTVGAGGGTIAYVDAAGLLHAGPEGAGARPGPAAYGLGGLRPTVTDAQLVLGRMKPGPHAGGAISLDLEKARAAIEMDVALPLSLDVDAAAAGIIRLVEENIRHAVDRVSVERGHDPRRFTLVAAGGAGPMHGAAVARAVGAAAVYIPRLAGVFCAFGMCNTDVRHDFQQVWLAELDSEGNDGALASTFETLAERGRSVLAREGFDSDAIAVSRAMDLRYAGQQWTIAVGTPDLNRARIRRDFEAEHERLYGYVQPKGRIDIVNVRVTATGRLPPVATVAPLRSRAPSKSVGRRMVWLDAANGRADTPVYSGADLRPGQSVVGPAVIDEDTTTILVGMGDRLTVTRGNNYLLELDSSRAKRDAAILAAVG